MGYPNVTVIYDDQTIKQTIPEVNSLVGKPVLMAVSSSDKGPEEFRTFDKEYIERYGDISFAKHGQSQIQVARILSAGGAVYYRRIVAPDSTLANISLVATTSQTSVQAEDANGAKLYMTPDGEETTAAEGNTPVMLKRAKIKYEVMSVNDLATLVKIGNNPKEIANIVKNQIDVENQNTENPDAPKVEKGDPDDLTKMGHVDLTANIEVSPFEDPVKAYTTITLTAKNDAVVKRCLFLNQRVNTIADFNTDGAVENKTDKPTELYSVITADNTLYVEYTNEAYPPELYYIGFDSDTNSTTEISLVLDKSELKAALQLYQTTENKDYTEDSWGAFQVALAGAVNALDDTADANQVSTARVNLKFAYDSLITNKVLETLPKKYLLFTLTDTGRGYSSKRFSISPNYQASKNASYTKYFMTVLEGTESTDKTLMFSMNPDTVDKNENKRLDTVLTAHSLQLRGVVEENMVNAFFEDVANKAGVSVAEVKETDILFGLTKKGKPNIWIEIDTDSIALDSLFGIALQGGSNGSFGNAPMDSEAYYDEVVKSFNGKSDINIYDVDNTTIHAIFDANYPIEVKHAIESLVNFREDCFYFRDLGIGLSNKDEIADVNIDMLQSKFCATYHNSYDVFDEWTKKQITVTCMYDLAPMFVSHYNLGINRPYAGILHGFTFPNVIEGTVNYIPKKIPGDNQPQELYDLNINYMKYYNGTLTLDTERTSQEVDSELSYINNVLAIQEIIRRLRLRCPRMRYSFKSGDDFIRYQRDIQSELNKVSGFFDSLELVYLEDMAQTDSKCYFAAVKVDCKDFVESEYFKITVI